jgi:hypothetical protein
MMTEHLDLHTIAVPAEHVCWSCIDDEAVLLNLNNGYYYTLNPVGCDVWQRLDGARTVQEIGAEMCDLYAVQQPQVEQDILALFRDLQHEDLIVFKSL